MNASRVLVLKLRGDLPDGDEKPNPDPDPTQHDSSPSSPFAQFCSQTTLHGWHYLGKHYTI